MTEGPRGWAGYKGGGEIADSVKREKADPPSTQTHSVEMPPGQTRVGCAAHEEGFDLGPRALILTQLPSRLAVDRMVENCYVPATGLASSWLGLALQSTIWT